MVIFVGDLLLPGHLYRDCILRVNYLVQVEREGLANLFNFFHCLTKLGVLVQESYNARHLRKIISFIAVISIHDHDLFL